MKKTKLLNVRYLVLITLGSANLFLFQNCSNYTGQISLSEPKELRSNKDLNTIAENSPALIEIGTQIASEPPAETLIEAPVIVQIDPPAVDESIAPAELPPLPPEALGTITTVISSIGVESTDQVGTAPAEPLSAPVKQPETSETGVIEQSSTSTPNSGSEDHSGDVAAAEPTPVEPSLGAVENPRVDSDRDEDDHRVGEHHDDDKDDHRVGENHDNDNDDHGAQEVAHSNSGKDEEDHDQSNEPRELPPLPPGSIVASSSVTVMPPAVHSDLCTLLSQVGNKLLKIPVVALGDDSNGKEVTIPNGKVIVISSSRSVLQLNKLAVGGNAIVCGDIKIKNFDSHGNATLIYAQADQASVNGKLITARLSADGIQVNLDNKSGNSVKSCSIGSDFKIVSNSSSPSNSHSNKNR